MKWDYNDNPTHFDINSEGLFILCEGNFQYSNATLSFYNPENNTLENEIFYRANGMKLGDVAQSMIMYADKGWIVINNSHVVFAIDPDTFLELGRIENLTSPRYLCFINDEKAYVSQLWDNRIFIVNPKTYSVTGHITVPKMTMESGSTEQMAKIGNFVYCTCWSYQNRLIKINTENDQVVGELTLGIQPKDIVVDKENKIWVLTDGGYEGSPYGYEPPSLYRIDPENLIVEECFIFEDGSRAYSLTINGEGDCLYWLNDDVWRMDISSHHLPSSPYIPSLHTKYYGLTVNPYNSEVYVADAIDYMQQGIIYRYSAQGKLLDNFYVGVTPGAFCWK